MRYLTIYKNILCLRALPLIETSNQSSEIESFTIELFRGSQISDIFGTTFLFYFHAYSSSSYLVKF